MRRTPVLVIHGGTGNVPDRRRSGRIRASLQRIFEAAETYARVHAAVETVVFAVQQMEDDPLFNAGTGSLLQQDGHARMSASVMDGAHGRFAAVLNIEQVRNPIRIAQALLMERDRVLDGMGAIRFARAKGFRAWDPITAERLAHWRRKINDHAGVGTVGAVVLDSEGRLASATSTGGKGFERIGRVSDSGMPAGNYADHRVAISCTGIGEDIIEEGLAVRMAQQVADGASLHEAAKHTARELRLHHRLAGAIALDHQGRAMWWTTMPAIFAMGRRQGRLATSLP